MGSPKNCNAVCETTSLEVLAQGHLPVVRAYRVVRLSRAAFYRPPISPARADAPVIAALTAVVADHGRWGFWKCFDRLRLQGYPWNHKRVHRVYCALRLNLPRRTKRRILHRLRQPLAAPPRLNHTWALDFMADVLYDRRHFRILTIIDEGSREALAVEAWTSIPASRVIRLLAEQIALHGRPTAIRVDNGPELLAQVLVDCCADRGIAVHYIQPRKPDQSAYIERFNRSYRTEIVDAHLFESLAEVRALTEQWLMTYNHERPHDSLRRVPPLTFLPRLSSPGQSPSRLST
jgi:putative transposase